MKLLMVILLLFTLLNGMDYEKGIKKSKTENENFHCHIPFPSLVEFCALSIGKNNVSVDLDKIPVELERIVSKYKMTPLTLSCGQQDALNEIQQKELTEIQINEMYNNELDHLKETEYSINILKGKYKYLRRGINSINRENTECQQKLKKELRKIIHHVGKFGLYAKPDNKTLETHLTDLLILGADPTAEFYWLPDYINYCIIANPSLPILLRSPYLDIKNIGHKILNSLVMEIPRNSQQLVKSTMEIIINRIAHEYGLFEKIAFINKPNAQSNSYVYEAAWRNNIALKILLEHSADANLKVKESITALDAACFSLNKEGLELLLAHGASMEDGTPLYATLKCKYGRTYPITRSSVIEFLGLLLEQGADPLKKNKVDNISALEYAQQNNDQEIVDLFKKYLNQNQIR